jgi:hypothetical protein
MDQSEQTVRDAVNSYVDATVILDQFRASLTHMIAPDARYSLREAHLARQVASTEARVVEMIRAAGGSIILDGHHLTAQVARMADQRTRTWILIKPLREATR